MHTCMYMYMYTFNFINKIFQDKCCIHIVITIIYFYKYVGLYWLKSSFFHFMKKKYIYSTSQKKRLN